MTDPTTPPPLEVAGLLIPATFVPRVVAAYRAKFPDETNGLTDHQALRAVLKAWTTQTVADYESGLVSDQLPLTVAQTVADNEAKASAAREQAVADAAGIVEAPDAPDPLTPPDPTATP